MKLKYIGTSPIHNDTFGRFEPGEIKEIAENPIAVSMVRSNPDFWQEVKVQKDEFIKNKAEFKDKKIDVTKEK